MTNGAKVKTRNRSDYISLDDEPKPRKLKNIYLSCIFGLFFAIFTIVILTMMLIKPIPIATDQDTGLQSNQGDVLYFLQPILLGDNYENAQFQKTLPHIDDSELNEAYENILKGVIDLYQMTDFTSDFESEELSPNFFLKAVNAPRLGVSHSRNHSCDGEIQNRLSTHIKQKYKLHRDQTIIGLRVSRVGSRIRECLSKHKDQYQCNKSALYRLQNGTCNNLRNPYWGAANSMYTRLMPPDYDDGILTPRRSKLDGGPLPSPRNISVEIHSKSPETIHPNISSLWTFFGQFITHDISKSVSNPKPLNCCADPFRDTPDCMPIRVSETDPFYGEFGVRCLDFTRSKPASTPDCVLGPREQSNEVTSFLDGSQIYGSSDEEANLLRSFRSGQLKTHRTKIGEFLPVISNNTATCSMYRPPTLCFFAGDTRTNENVILTSLHTIWMREHNRLALLLHKQNPCWNDELLFQEARRLVVAEFQHIVFNEYLPIVVGPNVTNAFDLKLMTNGNYYKGYSPRTNAAIGNEFSTAAFRFGHSAIADYLLVARENATEHMKLHHSLYIPSYIIRQRSTLNSILYGSAIQNSLTAKSYVTTELSNHLFESATDSYGLDLVSIHIQRGRDHGIPVYNDMRTSCGLKKLKSLEELVNVMDTATAKKFASIYKSVDDLDLLSAGVAENHLPGAQVGPLFACIIAEQFVRLRDGDRYWYENAPRVNPHPFTRQQLSQIHNITFARVLCDNVNITALHPEVFKVQSKWNQPVPCAGNGIPKLDISYWKETASQHTNL